MTAPRYQVSKPVLAGREVEYVRDAMLSGWISGAGEYVERLERAFAKSLAVDHCMAVNSGTAALHIACLALGLRHGMEVIVPSLTYVAAANAVAYCGARPVFVDCDVDTWQITPAAVVAAWTARTVGVIAVHLYGLPAPVGEIAELCRSRGAWLIEDCAESFGASLDGRATGTFGDAAAFSLFGNKIVSTGEGGMLSLRDPALRRHAALLRGQGMDPERRYWHTVVGYNYRMTNVAAAIGLAQLERLDYHLSERRRIAMTYRSELSEIVARNELRLPREANSAHSSYWLFSTVLSRGGGGRRDRIRERLLRRHGIETRPFFVPMHRLPIYRDDTPRPNAEFLAAHGMSFPTYSGLAAASIAEICRALRNAVLTVR